MAPAASSHATMRLAAQPSSASAAVQQVAEQEAEQLTPLEAAHVHAVLQTACDRLALLGVLGADPAVQAEQLAQSVGDGISRLLAQQKELEGRFHELVSAQRGQTNRATRAAGQAELAEVSAALRHTTKQLCRNLQDSPNVADNMAKVAAQRDALASLLAATLVSLDAAGTVAPVIESVLAADQAETDKRAMVEAEKAASGRVKELRGDIAKEKQQHDEQTREKRRAVAALKEQLRQERLQLAVESRYHDKQLAAANQAAQRLQADELAGLRSQLAQLQQQIAIERNVADTMQEFLAGRQAALAGAATGWASRRQEGARAKEWQLETLRLSALQQQDRLAEVEGRLQAEQAARAVRASRAAAQAEAAEAAAALQARQLAAAVTIQAAWRGFKARQEAKGAKSAKAKRKSSAKGKKGKAAK